MFVNKLNILHVINVDIVLCAYLKGVGISVVLHNLNAEAV